MPRSPCFFQFAERHLAVVDAGQQGVDGRHLCERVFGRGGAAGEEQKDGQEQPFFHLNTSVSVSLLGVMSFFSRSSSRPETGPGAPSATGRPSHSMTGVTSVVVPKIKISFACAACCGVMSRYSAQASVSVGDELLREVERAAGGGAGEDIDRRRHQQFVVRREDADVFGGAFAEIAVVVDGDDEVDAAAVGFELHQRVRQVVAGFDGGQLRRFDRHAAERGAGRFEVAVFDAGAVAVDDDVEFGAVALRGGRCPCCRCRARRAGARGSRAGRRRGWCRRRSAAARPATTADSCGFRRRSGSVVRGALLHYRVRRSGI